MTNWQTHNRISYLCNHFKGWEKNVEPLSFLSPNWILEMLSKLVHDNDLCMGRSAEYALLYKQSNLIRKSNWLPQDTTAHDSNLPQHRIVTTARVIHLLWCDLNALLWRHPDPADICIYLLYIFLLWKSARKMGWSVRSYGDKIC